MTSDKTKVSISSGAWPGSCSLPGREVEALVGSFLHELRSPLTAILSAGRVIAHYAGDRPETVTRFANVIAREGERLAALLNDTFELTRVAVGSAAYRTEAVDTVGLLEEVEGYLRALPEHAAVTVVFDLDEGLPALRADRGRLSQVLLLLLHSAIRAAAVPSTIRVLVSSTRPGYVDFCVEIEQPGSSATRQPAVPLLCREVIQSHQGTLLVRRVAAAQRPGYWLRLPVALSA